MHHHRSTIVTVLTVLSTIRLLVTFLNLGIFNAFSILMILVLGAPTGVATWVYAKQATSVWLRRFMLGFAVVSFLLFAGVWAALLLFIRDAQGAIVLLAPPLLEWPVLIAAGLVAGVVALIERRRTARQ